jgi:hypothetical protein
MLLTLASGNHTVEIRYRKGGARLDKLLLTNAADYVPGKLGG